MNNITHVQLDFNDNTTILALINSKNGGTYQQQVENKDKEISYIPVQLNAGHFKNTDRMVSEFNIFPVVRASVPEGEYQTDTNLKEGDAVTVTDNKVNEILTTLPKPAKTDEQLQTELNRLVEDKGQLFNNLRSEKLIEGIEWNTHTWDSDKDSIDNLTGIIAAMNAGIPLPPNFTWRDAGNVNVPMSAQNLIDLAAAMMTHVNTQYKTSWLLKDNIQSIADDENLTLQEKIDQIEVIDWP